MSGFIFPGAGDRVSIFGMTGSGKTRFGVWLFSHSDFAKRPYVIIDFKGDDLLMQIDRARKIDLKAIPKAPGLYYLSPRPDEQEEVNAWLWSIWARGDIGLLIDEGYMIKNSAALDAILTQGRSKRIPATILTQRPAWCSRFVFSEASAYAGFALNDVRDKKTVGFFTPAENPVWDFENPLPNYTARWYDVKNRYSAIIKPVPNDDDILQRYDDALKVKTRGI
jgi:hypothetical protein